MLRRMFFQVLRFLRLLFRSAEPVRGLPPGPGNPEEETPDLALTPAEPEEPKEVEVSVGDALAHLRALPPFEELLAEYERYLMTELQFMATFDVGPRGLITLLRTNTEKGYSYTSGGRTWEEEVPSAPHVRVWNRLSEAYAVAKYVEGTIFPDASSVRIWKDEDDDLIWRTRRLCRWRNEFIEHDGPGDYLYQSRGNGGKSEYFGSREAAFLAGKLNSLLEDCRRDTPLGEPLSFPDWATNEDILRAYAHLNLRKGVWGCP